MDVKNTLLFLAIVGLVVGLFSHTARAAGPSSAGGHHGNNGGQSNDRGNFTGGSSHLTAGGHHSPHHGGPRPSGPSTTTVNNNSVLTDGNPASSVVLPSAVFTPQQGTPYPCPSGYFPVGAEGLPFGYHVCRLAPETIRKAEEEGDRVQQWDVDYKAETAKTKAQIEYLKARRELLNELGED